MRRISRPSDFVFQVSWEVCNKVGGIYTVLSTQAKSLGQIYKDNLIYIGPDLNPGEENPLFEVDDKIFGDFTEKATKEGLPVRFGRWAVPGRPLVALVDFRPLFSQKDKIYADMWNWFGVDSLHAYGDYDEACLFALQAGRLIVMLHDQLDNENGRKTTAVAQVHEWMSGFALLYVKRHAPHIATVFTTHATSIGRSITTNEKPLYTYFNGYDGDQMAAELNMQSKHSVEKIVALEADCLTTVSEVTDRECLQFFGRSSDVILPNGFEPSFVTKGAGLQTIRHKARKSLLNTYNALAGTYLTDNTLIVSTSGRNDFRCKGFDVFLGSLAKLERNYRLERDVLAVIAVPCWKKQPREDLCLRLKDKPAIKIFDASGLEPLPHPFITHDLYNFDNERIVNTIYNCGLSLSRDSKVHLLFIPSYLDGDDGVINMAYYDFLAGSDYCVYPSYYEPWGYTPLESIAFGIPCLTTNLSGFGQWVNSTVGHTAILSDGVAVIQRDDSNYERATDEIATSIQGVAMLLPDEYSKIRTTAKALSGKALWKDFILNYINAYTLAMKHAANRS